MKGQAEMALILGLLVIAVIVGIYSYSSFTTPGSAPLAISEEQRGVEAYVRDAILSSTTKALGKIYSQGGFYDTQDATKTLDYANSDVAYWQICDQSVNIPNMDEEVAEGVEDQLLKNVPEKTDIAGRQVEFEFENLHVDARVYENKISITVNLPTEVDGVHLPQPFRLDVDSKLGRIYNFANDFANYQKAYRVVDVSLLNHINISNPDEEDEGACWLPTVGMITNTLRRSWSRIEECMQKQISHTLTHTYEWDKPWLREDGEMPLNLMENAYLFQIKKSDGTWGQYADLSFDFYYGGDEKHLTRADPSFFLGTDPDPRAPGGQPTLFQGVARVALRRLLHRCGAGSGIVRVQAQALGGRMRP